jgi:FKBP-type peptidyl-prolyl cis-trans isomerase (trigger factor)
MTEKTKTTQPKTFERKEDGTIELFITISQDEIRPVREQIINNAVQQAEIPGFRKGKAPRTVVEPTLDQGKIREEVLRKLLPEAYVKAVEANNLKPIMNPNIHVEKIEDDGEWTVHAVTCEMPEVKLGNYKEEIKKVTAKSKIILPGKEKQEPAMDEIMKALMANVEVKVPAILVSQEVDRLLSQTLDEIKRLGLTLDQYLSSTGKTPDTIREDFAQKAANDITMEFTLQKIAEVEKITVENKEIEEAIQKSSNPIEKDQLEKNQYFLASLIRQQKTLDFLKNL